MQFDYREFNNRSRVLDAELGGMYGLSFRLGQRLSEWEWESDLSHHRGRVPYDGQLTSGTPYDTRTDEIISDVSLRFGRWYEQQYPLQPYLGIGYRRWDRDILPGAIGSTPVNGLFESYRWSYFWIGTKLLTRLDNGSHTLLDIGLLKPLSPELHVDFRGTYAISPTVYPESKLGLRMRLTSSLALSGGNRFAIEPYLEYWELGRSPTVVEGGIPVYEPASQTNNVGVNLRVDWSL